ncbi:MAG: hypothetical protein JWM27_311 [Gemmatimonadetes bacterium]|nr:hypothetical protein [Gemmatimonadota bacterium]
MRAFRRSFPMAALLLAALAGPARAAVDPVAVLVRVLGRVQVQRGTLPAAAAAVGMPLQAGDQVVVPAGGQAVVLYRTGRTEMLSRSSRIAAPAAARRNGVFRQTVKTLTEVAVTDARTQPNRQGMIRPIAGAAVPVSPRNGLRVRSAHPTFTWFAVPGVTDYVIQLRPVDGGAVVRFPVGADTTWRLPDSAAALVSGAVYEWSVAWPDGRAAVPQRFRVATPAEEAAVAARIGQLWDVGLNPRGDGLFPAAAIYRDAGFVYDARRALDELAATGAPLGRDYHLLRATVYDALGMVDAAQAEFALADGGVSGGG